VINISSPNTPGLRDWQTNEGGLHSLLTACLTARNLLVTKDHSATGSGLPPLFVKLAPDLTEEELIQIAKVCENVGIDGFVVANTTKQRPADLIHHHLANLEEGGLSGRPVRDLSTSMIRTLYATTEGRIPIIGVGGISSGHDAYEKLKAGASLVQVYSHLVYSGPGFVSRLRQELAQLLVLHGHRNVADVVGLDHEEITWKKRHERLAIKEQTHEQL
jgi:dihydroorotate dehydrogenase